MNTFTRTVLTWGVLACAAAAAAGCGGAEEIPQAEAESIPVYNPEPDYELKDVTLENESENLEAIGGMSR